MGASRDIHCLEAGTAAHAQPRALVLHPHIRSCCHGWCCCFHWSLVELVWNTGRSCRQTHADLLCSWDLAWLSVLGCALAPLFLSKLMKVIMQIIDPGERILTIMCSRSGYCGVSWWWLSLLSWLRWWWWWWCWCWCWWCWWCWCWWWWWWQYHRTLRVLLLSNAYFISDDWAKDPDTTMMGIIFEDFIEVQLSS